MTVKPALGDFDADRRATLRRTLSERGRLQIDGILSPEYAAYLCDQAQIAPFVRTHLDNSSAGLTSDQMGALTPEVRAQVEAALREARMTYYVFDNVAIHAEAQLGRGLPVWRELTAFLNSAEMLDFIRDLTEETRIDHADAQLTRFSKGHFLTAHTDEAEGKNRYYAYVVSLTKVWTIDWGGLLAFHGDDDNVSEAWTPRFNTLNLFKVPQLHSVTRVSPEAKAERLSVTGWFRGR